MYRLSHGHVSTCATFPWSRKMFYILKTFAYDAWKNFYKLLNANSLAKTHTKLFLKNELAPPKTLQSSFKLKKSWKNFTTLIFFQWKLRCCFFQISHRADTLFRILVLNAIIIFKKKSEFSKFQIKIDCPVSARCKIWKEQHLSFHWKKN